MNRWLRDSLVVLRRLGLDKDDPEAKKKSTEAYPFGVRKYWHYQQWLKAVGIIYPWAKRKQTNQKPLPKWLGGEG